MEYKGWMLVVGRDTVVVLHYQRTQYWQAWIRNKVKIITVAYILYRVCGKGHHTHKHIYTGARAIND